MLKNALAVLLFLAAALGTGARAGAQEAKLSPPMPPWLHRYLLETVGMSPGEVAEIEHGHTAARSLPSRGIFEIYLVGAVYVDAPPESYLRLATNMEYLRKLAGSMAMGAVHVPPRPEDLNGFVLDEKDAESMKSCRPGDCLLQMTRQEIEAMQRSAPWKNGNAAVDQYLQRSTLTMLNEYMQGGNAALGVYDDKPTQTDVAREFRTMLNNDKALPMQMQPLYQYLLDYPHSRPQNATDAFYWSQVKFGFKPTLRLVHEVTWRGGPKDEIAAALVRKQIYASHYFKTAMDFSFCVPVIVNGQQRGFYLVMVLSSEMALEGFKGSILHEVGVSRSLSEMQKSMTMMRNQMEATH